MRTVGSSRPPRARIAFHLGKYGHPSEFGFKDVINTWHAEKFEPDKLLAVYKRAGTKYFVALANHHCNFDAWDSRIAHAWNSVNVGPKEGPHWPVAKAGAKGGYCGQLRRERACRPAPGNGMSRRPGLRSRGAAVGRPVRWQADQSRWQGQVVGRAGPAGTLCPEPQARGEARQGLPRPVLPADEGSSRQLQAGPGLFRRLAAADERDESV